MSERASKRVCVGRWVGVWGCGGGGGCLATYWAGYILPGLVTACAFRMTRPRVRVEDLLPRNFLKRKKTNKPNGKPHDPSAGTEVAVNIFSKHGSSVDRNAGMELIYIRTTTSLSTGKKLIKKKGGGGGGYLRGVCVCARACVCVCVCMWGWGWGVRGLERKDLWKTT